LRIYELPCSRNNRVEEAAETNKNGCFKREEKVGSEKGREREVIGTKERIFMIKEEKRSEKLPYYDTPFRLLIYLSVFPFIDKDVC